MTLEKLRSSELVWGYEFTKGTPLLRVPGNTMGMIKDDPEILYGPNGLYEGGDMLFDLEHDPRQMTPLKDPETEQRMKNAMIRLMEENETPPDQYIRLGLK